MTPNIDTAERMKIIAARMNAGQDTYAGRQDAWHQLGIVTGKYNTWRELLQAAGANFEVIKKQLSFHGRPVAAWGTFRMDDVLPKGIREEDSILVKSSQTGVSKWLTFLGSVGEGYEVIQHTQGFELLDSFVGEVLGSHYETMGTLDFGRMVWGQVNPQISIKVGDDESTVYLSFLTSHDGSKATEIYETAVRQVCRNTVRLGQLKRLAARLRVKHTKYAQSRMDTWKAELEEIRDLAMSMQEKLNFLAKRKVNRESMDSIMDRLFPKKKVEGGEDESSTRRENILSDVLSLYEHNDGNQFPEQRGTAYNLLNAITEYVDHLRSSKNDMRAESALFGSGDKLKSTALDLIINEASSMSKVQESIAVDYAALGWDLKKS